jgi:hypothetical protein
MLPDEPGDFKLGFFLTLLGKKDGRAGGFKITS